MTRESISLPAIPVSQPLGEYYIAAISRQDLLAISYVDRRELKSGKKTDYDSYTGIQRVLNKDRLPDIEQFVNTIDASFPTSIVLSIDERCAEYSEGKLTLKPYIAETGLEGDTSIPYDKIARVLDGQHRLAALDAYTGDKPFDLNVSIFIGSSTEEDAYIFSTVNLAQTKVNRSLVYDLAAYATHPSPQKSCHEIAVVLDGEEASPFYKKIKRLGIATPGRSGETITQATFVQSLICYISDNPSKDRDALKRGHKLDLITDSDEIRRLPFRNFFIEERDDTITKIIWSYFEAVRETWPTAWANEASGQMIYRTNGFRGFMRFLRDAYNSAQKTPDGMVYKEDFASILAPIAQNLSDADFNTNVFLPGGAGELTLYKRLMNNGITA